MCKIVISGQVPSLKNAKTISYNSKTGKPFVRTEQRVKDYMEAAKLEVKSQWRLAPLDKIDNLTCVFYYKDKRIRDLSNSLDTTLDVIKKIIVKDDSAECIPEIQLHFGGYDSKNPRTELWVDFAEDNLEKTS